MNTWLLNSVQWAIVKGVALATGFNLDEVGKVIKFEIDPGNGLIRAMLELKGEDRPIVIDELTYIVKNGRITLASLHSDREWLNALGSMALPVSFEPGESVIKAMNMLK